MIVIYLRVSTGKQCTKTQDFAIEEYAKKKGYKVVKYVDYARTGKNMKRPEFQRMLADCRAGKIKKIVTFELSRLSRDMLSAIALCSELHSLKVQIETIGGIQKFDTPQDILFCVMTAFQAQTERENTAARTKAGMARAKAEREAKIASGVKEEDLKNAIGFPGTRAGRAKAAHEHWVHPKTGFRKDYRAEDPGLVDEIMEFRGDGLTYREIARRISRRQKISHQKVFKIVQQSGQHQLKKN